MTVRGAPWRVWAAGSWNPLVCRGTDLPPNLLISGKLLAFWLLVRRGPAWIPRVHLPFLQTFDQLGPATSVLERSMAVAFLLFTVALLLNRSPRLSCLVLGTLVLTGIVMDRTTFSNNVTLAGSLLLLIGLHEPGRPPWLPRAQLVLVYFGAGLNKLLDPDWQSGVFFEFWTRSILEHQLYMELAAALPPLLLSKAMCWFVIATELLLAVGLALPRLYRWILPAGILFHVGMLVFTGGTVSWLFLYVMWAGFVAVAPWPDTPIETRVRGGRGRAVRRVLERLDGQGLYRWRQADHPTSGTEATDQSRDSAVAVQLAGTDRATPTVWTGATAVLLLLLVNPIVHAFTAVLLLWGALPGFVRRTVGLLTGGG